MYSGVLAFRRISIVLLLFFIFHLSSFSLSAQQPWNYESVEEACLGDAYLVQPDEEMMQEVEHVVIGKVRYNAIYHISGPYVEKRFLNRSRRYIRFQCCDAGMADATDFRLPVETAERLLPWLVSRSYWQQRFDIVRRWDFVDASLAESFIGTDGGGRYCNIAWLSFHFQPSVEWPVYFTVALAGGEPQCLSLADMEQLAQQGAFATFADWQRYAVEDDLVWQRHNEMYVALQRHFDSLSDVSRQLDRHADSMLTALHTDSLAVVAEQNRAEVESFKARMMRDEIFFMNINPARSEYMFGLEFNLFNCYQKTITKIEITVTPYNDRSRVQRDKFGRTTRTVRCMGPIRPGTPAQYSFDELYWNDEGKIKYMRVTGIVFHFTDGTTQSYSGYDKIMRHSLR